MKEYGNFTVTIEISPKCVQQLPRYTVILKRQDHCFHSDERNWEYGFLEWEHVVGKTLIEFSVKTWQEAKQAARTVCELHGLVCFYTARSGLNLVKI